MKKKLILFLLLSFIITGCGADTNEKEKGLSSAKAQNEVSVLSEGQEDDSVPGEEDSIAFLDKLSEKLVTPVDTDYKILQKKYPQWFDKNGDIVYPILPGSVEWKDTKTPQERYDLCQIPTEIVDAVDTASLLKAVEKHPLFLELSFYDSYYAGLEYMSNLFYGLHVLLQRKDAYKVAASSYLERNPGKTKDAVQVHFELFIEEFLLSRKYAYQKLGKEERKEILKAIANNYEMENEIKSAASGREYHFYDMVAYENNPWQKEAMSFVETTE